MSEDEKRKTVPDMLEDGVDGAAAPMDSETLFHEWDALSPHRSIGTRRHGK